MSALIRLGEVVFPHLLDAAWKGTVLLMIIMGTSSALGRTRLVTRYWLAAYTFLGLLILPIGSFLARDQGIALLRTAARPGDILPTNKNAVARGESVLTPPRGLTRKAEDTADPGGLTEEPVKAESDVGVSDVRGAEANTSRPLPAVMTQPRTETDSPAGDANQPGLWKSASAAKRSLGTQPAGVHLTMGTFPWRGVIGLAWLAGCTVFLLRLLVAGMSISRIRRASPPFSDAALLELFEEARASAGVKSRATLRSCKRIDSLVSLGILRPSVLLPESFGCDVPPEQIRPLLLHELAHIHWRDYAVNVLQRLTEAFFFFHPLVWLMSRRLRHMREEICDDWVLDHYSEKTAYARALMELAGRSLRPGTNRLAALGLFGRCALIRKRIERILASGKRPAARLSLRTALALLSISLVIVGGLSFTSLSARAVEEESVAKQEPPSPPILEGDQLKKVTFVKTAPRYTRYELPPLPVLLMSDGRAMVPGQRIWSDTGLDVSAGQIVSVSAGGQIRGCNQPPSSWAFGPWGPEGARYAENRGSSPTRRAPSSGKSRTGETARSSTSAINCPSKPPSQAGSTSESRTSSTWTMRPGLSLK